MVKDKNIVIGISGGIAAYKIVDLVSRLKKQGANIKVIMTKNACEFITPTTLAAISGNKVSVEHFPTQEMEHITLADWADIFVVAPATANIIGKIANGIADDLLTSTILATTAPKLSSGNECTHVRKQHCQRKPRKTKKTFFFYYASR